MLCHFLIIDLLGAESASQPGGNRLTGGLTRLMHQGERLAVLRRVPILAELPDTRLERLAGICKWQDYPFPGADPYHELKSRPVHGRP
jgi:hypothetical protein